MSATPAPFAPRRPRHPRERRWLGDDRWDAVPVLDLPAVAQRYARVLVLVGATPTTRPSASVAWWPTSPTPAPPSSVLVATDGERSHPVERQPGPRAPWPLAPAREVERAVGVLAPGGPRRPTSACPTARWSSTRRPSSTRCGAVPTPTPWCSLRGSPTGTPTTTPSAGPCAAAVSHSGADLAHYPIWLWHWGTPDALPWPDVVASETSRTASWRKRAALEEFPSQTTAWGDPDDRGRAARPGAGHGNASTAPAASSRRWSTPRSALPTRPATTGWSAAPRPGPSGSTGCTTTGDDPWAFAGSFYEERRRALVLALLGCRRYGRALEIGCADGRLTAGAARALRRGGRARHEPPGRDRGAARAPGAVVEQGMAPADLPPGPFDLVLLSEVGYFLTPLELVATLRRCEESLAPGGELVLCHWQHPTQDVPLDGVLVHEQAATVLRARRRATYLDDDLRIDVWGDGASLARREGRA